jgi:hypothetical protein
MTKFNKVTSIEQLKEICLDNQQDFIILLVGGLKSSKCIFFDSEDRTWNIVNYIDSSEQCLLENEIVDEKITNIGIAIQNGNFYHEI